MKDCLFCGIVAGEVAATRVHEDDAVIAFRDINAQAPVHILVIPREHIDSAAEVTPAQDAIWARLLHVACECTDQGVDHRTWPVTALVGAARRIAQHETEAVSQLQTWASD